MYALPLLHKILRKQCSKIHSTRLNTCLIAVQALTEGAKASVTSLGRGLPGHAYDKHKIKRIDRLLSNDFLYQERHQIYSALTQQLLSRLPEPVIAIDWSPLCADQSWQLLRAAIPVGGRSLTLYEEVHPRIKLANRKVQHRFLDQLATMMPEACRPIVVADSGFKTPFYYYVENTLQWHWVGRIRGQDFLSWHTEGNQWFSAKSLYSKATKAAKHLGQVRWTQRNPFAAFIVLVRQSKKDRKSLTLSGKERQSKQHKTHANREKEPWLLVASLSLHQRTSKQIVKIYRTRMQIEEGFRDCKAVKYGLGLSSNRRVNQNRRSILCLLAALAIFVLWCVGMAGRATDAAKQLRVNSSSKREPYSAIFLARLLVVQKHFQLTKRALDETLNHIQSYMFLVLAE
jgi:hypothetical protein